MWQMIAKDGRTKKPPMLCAQGSTKTKKDGMQQSLCTGREITRDHAWLWRSFSVAAQSLAPASAPSSSLYLSVTFGTAAQLSK